MRGLLIFRRRLAEDDLPLALLWVAFGAFACVMPAQADTFYHLRSGQEMWQAGSLIRNEPFSWTFPGRPLANHWWVTQLLFYGIHAVGGPVLLTTIVGVAAIAAVISSWQLVAGSFEIRLLALLGYALTLPEWSVRPQVFSLFMTATALRFILSDRPIALLMLLVLWANMHAMVVLGIAIAAVPLIDAVLWDRSRLRGAGLMALAAIATPLLTPFGSQYWPSLIATVQASRSLGLHEYRSAFNLDAMTVMFWLVACGLGYGFLRTRARFDNLERGSRLLALTALVLVPTGITSVRNIPFFVLAAIPALSRLFSAERATRLRPASRAAWATLAGSVVLALALVVARWSNGGRQLGWQPLTPAASAAIESCPARMYNGLYEGGQLIWFTPRQRVFIDGRVEAYPVDFMRRARDVELGGDYRELFSDYGIRCAVVRPDSPVYTAIRRDATMRLAFIDDRWAVFVRQT